jgi:hypothetical protein
MFSDERSLNSATISSVQDSDHHGGSSPYSSTTSESEHSDTSRSCYTPHIPSNGPSSAFVSSSVVGSEATLPPILTLPDELLGEIFLQAHEDTDLEEDRDYSQKFKVHSIMDARSEPWIFGQVCQRWRTLMEWSLPLAWSKIDINLDWLQNSLHMQDILRTVLRRSEPAPLYILLSVYASASEEQGLLLINELFGAADRWAEIRMHLQFKQPWIDRLHSIKSDFPHLQCIDLRHCSPLVPSV